MKKVGLLLCLGLGLASLTTSAQTNENMSKGAGRNATFVSNGFWDNWFIGAGASGNVFVAPGDQHTNLTDRITLGTSLQLGKWINPYIGIRAVGEYGTHHTFDASRTSTAGNTSMYRTEYVNAHVDMMWNVTNYLCQYRENRFYNFIPTLGVGFNHQLDEPKDDGNMSLSLNASLLNTFRISKRLSFFAEIGGSLVDNRFNRHAQGGMYLNGVATGTAGLILKIGRVGFNEAVLMDQNLVDDLNNQINRLRSENAELSKRPVSCPPVQKCPEVQQVIQQVKENAQSVVFFRLGSANIDNNQAINIYNTAEYLKKYPNAKVKVIGYADKKTGTASVNDKLSEKRAKNVANTLVKKYGIDESRVNVEWKGSSEQPYEENAWNRVAIMFAD